MCNFANSPSFIAPESRSSSYGFPRGGEAGAQRLMRGFAQANKNVDYLGAAYCCLTADPHPPLQGTFSSREKANEGHRKRTAQILNDRKIIPRAIAPPGRAVIPRTLAPPGRAIVPRTLAPPCRAGIPSPSFNPTKKLVIASEARRSPDYSSPAQHYPTQEIATGYALAMTDLKCSAERASPQILNDRDIIPRIFVPPGAYPPRREESLSG